MSDVLGSNELRHFDRRAIQEAAQSLGISIPEVYRMVYDFELAADFPLSMHRMYYDYVNKSGREPKYFLVGIKEYFAMKYRAPQNVFMVVYQFDYMNGHVPVKETIVGVEIMRVAKLSCLEIVG